jgi:hypothetical protein
MSETQIPKPASQPVEEDRPEVEPTIELDLA